LFCKSKGKKKKDGAEGETSGEQSVLLLGRLSSSFRCRVPTQTFIYFLKTGSAAAAAKIESLRKGMG